MSTTKSALLVLAAGAGLVYAQRPLPLGPLHQSSGQSQNRNTVSGGRSTSSRPVWNFRPDGTLRVAHNLASRAYPGDPESAAHAFLRDYPEVFGSQPPDFEVSRVRPVAGFTLVRMQQTVEGIPVHGRDLVLMLDSNNAVRSASAHYTPSRPVAPQWRIGKDAAAAAALASKAGQDRQVVSANQVWFDDGGELAPAWQVFVQEAETEGLTSHWLHLVSAENGEVLETQDLRFGESRQAKAYVFPTNPLAGDVTPVSLGNLTPGTAYLFGSYAKVYSNLNVLLGFSPAGTVTAMAAADGSGNYPYLPMDPRHAEVQLYWAMDRAAQNFRSVGYPGLGRPLNGVTEWADCGPDGCAIQNNAYFDPLAFSGSGGLFIYYCRAGEPAYDTGVMFHEFTHSVVSDIVGITQGTTFRALNEGTADYFSDSFLDDPADTPYAALIWGMRLPYLRTAANQNLYPRNLVGEAHLDGNIWSGALWELRKLLGATRADPAVLLTIASLSSSAEFYDAAVAAVNVTGLLYGHDASAAAEQILTARGLLSASAAFGADPHFLRSGALPVVDSIAAADQGSGRLADRQFRFSVPLSGTSFKLRLMANNSKLIALLKHRSPVVVYDDGTTNADYISDVSSEIAFDVNQASDPEIQFGDYYLWVGHYNTQSSTEYAVYMDLQAAGNSLSDIRVTALTVNGSPATGSMPAGPILNSREFLVQVPENATALGIKVEGETDMDLYIRYASPVSYNNQGFPEADVVRATTASSEVAIVARNTVPNLAPGYYVVGVYNADERYPSHFRVTAASSSDPIGSPALAGLAARTPVSVTLPGALGAAVLADTELTIDVPDGTADLRLSFSTTLDAHVYLRQGKPISFSKGWPVADFSFRTRERKDADISTSSATPLKPGRYYLWIANASDTGGAVSVSYTLF